MRAYFFGNLYLSSIQQGLQSGHVITELFIKYNLKYGGSKADILEMWATDYKTMILLNGGYSENIRKLCEFFFSDDNSFPWALFNEGQDALDGALTCAGIVLPEWIYEAAVLIRNTNNGCKDELNATNALYIEDTRYEYSDWDIELIERLNKFGLAK